MAATRECPVCGMSSVRPAESVGDFHACPHCGERVASGNFTMEPAGHHALRPIAPASIDLRFTFTCLRCDSILEARSGQSGQLGRCPTCGGVFTIPPVDTRTGLALGPARVADDGQLPTPLHAYATAGTRAPRIERLDSGEQVIVCSRCGRRMPIDSNICAACGLPFTIEGAAEVHHPRYQGNGPAAAALLLGVLSLPTFCLPLIGVAAVAVGIVGVHRAQALGPDKPGQRTALVGLILGLASCGMWFFWM